jgi:hypothetical protein
LAVFANTHSALAPLGLAPLSTLAPEPLTAKAPGDSPYRPACAIAPCTDARIPWLVYEAPET